MVKREQYAAPAGANLARNIQVDYVDTTLTREEIWSVLGESDAPRQFQRRVSPDNGRTWSAFEEIESGVNVQRPDGGLVSYPASVHVDQDSGRIYRVVMRRAWPGLPLYTYDWSSGKHVFNDHLFISVEEGEEQLLRYEEGPDWDPDYPFDPAFCTTNRAYCGSGMAFGADGAAFYPIVCYQAGEAYSFCAGGVRLMRRDGGSGQWFASQPRFVNAAVSARGLLEPDVALLRDGRLLVVCRGSDTPSTPGRKWRCLSSDGGRTLSEVEPFGYDDGSSFYSPSSIHRFFRSTRNGRLYWIGNIVDAPPQGNGPRYPLCIAEVDEETAALRKESVTKVDDRGAGDSSELQLSNWSQLENRETLDWEFYLSRVGEQDGRFWESGVTRYVFSPDGEPNSQ